MKFKILYPVFFLFIGFAYAQEFEFSGSVNLQGITASEDESPFWFHSNKRGRIDESTNTAGWANLNGKYNITSNAFFEIGAGALYQNGFTDKLQLDEIYLSFQNSWLIATLGRKQRKELYNGLSATNENMLWSLNARPMPGISLSTARPIVFWKEAGLAFTASWEEFLMDDDRYVDHARVHHKSFHLVFSKIKDIEVSMGVQHFAQWAGTSPEYGDLPDGFDNYLDVVTGQGMGGDAENEVTEQEINGLGNHLGSYEISLKTHYNNYEIQLFWNHIFEDGSGSMFRNTPDGRYGVYVSGENKEQFINGFIYEFYYTKDQSNGSTVTSDGIDNYFNNNLYRSGWTYESRVLGVPFFTLNENRFRIGNNRFMAHHIGIGGIAFKKVPYKFLTSFRKNYGAKGINNYQENNVLSSYLDVLVWQSFFNVNVQIGSDFSSIASPNLGVGLRLSKKLF